MAKRDRPRALRYVGGNVRNVAHRTATAAQVIGRLEPGLRVTGVTAAQFSAIDALEHMVNELGQGEVRISTWTTGLYDVHRARSLRAARRIADIRMLLDRWQFEKSPKYAGALIEALGIHSIRCVPVHAKVVVVTGEHGAAAFRSSMNLNKNLRTEQFDLDVDDAVAGFYAKWFDELWAESARSQDNRTIIRSVYDRFRRGVEEEAPREQKRPRRPRARAPKLAEVLFSPDDLSGLID